MKDRFKFRFWDKETKTMQKFLKIELRQRMTLDTIFDDDRVIFMQCTGLKDRNGILAYEGDIVEEGSFTGKNADKHRRYLIVEDISGTGFRLKQINPTKYDYTYWHINRLQYDYSVIGNKFENPGLLEE